MTKLTDDQRDIEVARERLREIHDDPSSLVIGEALAKRLLALEQE
jgi:hypothetical protein